MSVVSWFQNQPHGTEQSRDGLTGEYIRRIIANLSLKLLISGAPGIGKSSLVNLLARTLASHPAAIEDVNGRDVGLELAREWTRSVAYSSMFGP